MTDRDSLAAHLATTIEPLNADELEVLCRIAEGLAAGRRQYGPLRVDADGRDWIREALEEHRDAAVYTTVELMRLSRRR